jgi:hypothetical protein
MFHDMYKEDFTSLCPKFNIKRGYSDLIFSDSLIFLFILEIEGSDKFFS